MHFFLFLVLALFFCSCTNKEESPKTNPFLTIAAADDPTSLDPRNVRDLSSSTVMRILYEGLTRSTFQGKIIPGIAESYTISDDQKTYTFHLRPSTWSDGSLLTAEDFEETWKTILSPSFPAPNAYQLYPIKGAKAAKEGLTPMNNIGVKAVDSSTLVVELENPTPYFLELTSCHFFFPVHQSLRTEKPNYLQPHVGNGPFKLDQWTKRDELKFVKNSNYWDEKNVSLEGISIQILDEHTALQLFKTGKLDWAGSPLSTLPQDVIAPLKEQNQLQIAEGAGTHWFRINTVKIPFNNIKIRRAFSLALDRKAIVEHVTQGNQQPAFGIIPPSFGLQYQEDNGHNLIAAKKLFNEGLIDSRQKKTDLNISLSYASNDRNHKIAQAVQQQWNTAFDIDVKLNANESHIQIDKMKKGNYEISMGSWFADIQDPVNFLEIFQSIHNPTNQTFWQNRQYTILLNLSAAEPDPAQRLQLFSQAEKILIEEMPVIPLFHSAYNYLKSEGVSGVYFSPLGFVDFKDAKKQ